MMKSINLSIVRRNLWVFFLSAVSLAAVFTLFAPLTAEAKSFNCNETCISVDIKGDASKVTSVVAVRNADNASVNLEKENNTRWTQDNISPFLSNAAYFDTRPDTSFGQYTVHIYNGSKEIGTAGVQVIPASRNKVPSVDVGSGGGTAGPGTLNYTINLKDKKRHRGAGQALRVALRRPQ